LRETFLISPPISRQPYFAIFLTLLNRPLSTLHCRRRASYLISGMAKKISGAKTSAAGRAGSPLPAASQTDDGAHGVARPTKLKPSALLDTRVVYCGDNLEQLGPCRTGQGWGSPREITSRAIHPRCLRHISRGETKEKHAGNSAFRTPHSAIDLAGSFYYHCDWHASHYVKVMLDQIFGENNFSRMKSSVG
jgi:hypothetical protein